MVSQFVRDDVGLGEVTRRAETTAQFIEEPEVEIYIVVSWTVERAAGRLREAAGGLNRIAKQPHLRWLVAITQQLLPCHLRVLHDSVDKIDELLLFRRARGDAARRAHGFGG